jgi:hypothetical protein
MLINISFTFCNDELAIIGLAALAYANALLSIAFKAGSYTEKRINYGELMRTDQEKLFYHKALVNLFVLGLSPTFKLIANKQADEGLNSPWLYLGLLIVGAATSDYLEGLLNRYEEKATELARGVSRTAGGFRESQVLAYCRVLEAKPA